MDEKASRAQRAHRRRIMGRNRRSTQNKQAISTREIQIMMHTIQLGSVAILSLDPKQLVFA